ncbi:electrogenic aspartate/glutamate antiporter SLC25A13, mitochondrial-like [Halichondria panicea]|uniref:electrogenic aspartate/glutamate antiporter SLC25A13, mitochondrial-like n=1 Tax=Halichondria panicea TaxID=6063 RepID=UPI00312BC9FC
MAVTRADSSDLRVVFNKYASVTKEDQSFLSYDDFVVSFLQLVDKDTPPDTVRQLAAAADTTKSGLISFDEFRSFETMLISPDYIPRLAFKLFDKDKRSRVSFSNFKAVLGATSIHTKVPFNFDSNFLKLYFGQNLSLELGYHEFCQLLQSLPTEHARQAFSSCDTDQDGSIRAEEYVKLMKTIRGFRLSPHVQDHLLSVAGGSPGSNVNFAYFKAFNQLLGNLDLMEKIVTTVTDGDQTKDITESQLLREAQTYSQITPLQVSLLCQLCSVEDQTKGTITLSDFRQLLPNQQHTFDQIEPAIQPVVVKETERSDIPVWKRALEPVYRFSIGGLAGAAGATSVYPIDLVKTRLQNQRGSMPGEIMYKNSFDCFKKVVKFEGFRGLYRGLLPQLVGVSPEKAIKLTANDTVRDLLRSKDGNISLWKEVIAGGTGGMCQVMFTNPLEIVKIRLQVAGEMGQQARALSVVRELGIRGLYLGSRACFLRDITFSGIYFPAYAHLKTFFGGDRGQLNPAQLFAAAFIAGVPAAGLVTPADVIKTRLQVVARKGQQSYSGVIDCYRKIVESEGQKALWKGAPARIFRSSPQFGVTLVTYELIQRLFYVDFGHRSKQFKSSVPSAKPTKPLDSAFFHLPDHVGGYRVAHSAFSGVESRFGIIFPKTK